ncbi:MAG: polysaccharide biosynthesis C-terminal domain-containing protein, partial [Muribaculaceae bacterium]|nr:polysaccharide biosynthesis C-terminal domain-containing protein [Muribaculaceae bacterium]
MEKTESTGLDYSQGKIGTLFMKIFIPTLLGMISTALITIIDGVFVGQGVGPDGIAAVNIIAPIYMVATGFGLMFGIGASVIAGMALAEGNRQRTDRVVSQSFAVVTVIMLLLIAVVLLCPQRVARMMGSSEHLMPHAVDYLTWIVPATLFVAWSSIGMMVIRLDGSPKYAMMINVVSSVLNIIGDYILIFPFGMGVKGAAIATSASVAVGGVMALVYFRWSYVIKLRTDMSGLWNNMKRVLSIGSSAFVTEVAMSVMMFTGNYIFMKYYADAGVAAFSIACYLFPLMFMMSNAVAQSSQPIISYNAGTGAKERVAAAFRLSRTVALTCGVLVAAGISLSAGAIVGMFIPVDSEAGTIAVAGLPVFSVCAVFFALNIAYIGYCQSIGLAMRAMI